MEKKRKKTETRWKERRNRGMEEEKLNCLIFTCPTFVKKSNEDTRETNEKCY